MAMEGEVPHPEVRAREDIEVRAREDIHRRPVRMSMRPPVRYSAGVDLELWLTRFELYARGATVPETEWKAELLPLLDDESFRAVNQLGLVQAGSYEDVKAHLKCQFAPEGDVFEWQHRLQSRVQKPGESLAAFAGALRMLADRAYPSWVQEQKQELVRNQFIQGIRSASIQLQLMRDRPDTPDGALQLAIKLETVELAQKRLRSEKQPSQVLSVNNPEAVDDTTQVAGAVGAHRAAPRDDRRVEELAEQVRHLSDEITHLRTTGRRSDRRNLYAPRRPTSGAGGPVCWSCGERGHLRRDCPTRVRWKEERLQPDQQRGDQGRPWQPQLNGRQPVDRVVRRL